MADLGLSPLPQSEQPAGRLPNRDIRHREIVPAAQLAKVTAVVVGVGAVGRQLALQLAATGVPTLVLIDFDTVDEENLAVQGFFESDLGKKKVDAVGDVCQALNHDIAIKRIYDPFDQGMLREFDIQDKKLMLFSCVDRMDVREALFKASAIFGAVYYDGRMGPEVSRVLVVSNPEERDYYQHTMFTNEQMVQTRCTAKTTLYCANITAGLIMAQFTRNLRGFPAFKDAMFNILTGDIGYDVDADRARSRASA